ncbi:extensin family protein [Jannaschia sp. M317]|uniref:extensin-like domain-containing protein n=1 Tax=Jannaschia sp. M317 TaxID=2867011 RepID=UPI0021A85538|nr:extensin family protein [Jannaschia sp. M317]UWQ18530.1 extensin family protein [Jannaschia sp. M317]
MRLFLRLASLSALLAALGWGGNYLLTDPNSPLPAEMNPTLPLDLSRPESGLTGFKLRRALASDATCLAALKTGATFDLMPPLETENPQCGIAPRVRLSAVGPARLAPVETACETALRLAAWRAYVLPEAESQLGIPVTELAHQGSYNCRPIRGGTRMSTHATARAIDIRGVTLADGRLLPLSGNWSGDGPEAAFWRGLRDGGCDWFTTVLGPDFNAAHADHLHLQSGGWGTCR